MYLDKDSLVTKLRSEGLDYKTIDTVVTCLQTGLDIKLCPSKFDFHVNEDVSIRMLNQKGELPTKQDMLTASHWDINIAGIDTNQLLEVHIPTLSAVSTKPFILGIKFYPFKVSPIKIKNKDNA